MLALTSNTDPMIAVGPSAPIDTTTADALARRAAALTKVKLERHDNALSPAHAEAIDRVSRLTTQLATGTLTGRHAVPLDCGLGKTQLIVHWCAAVVDLDLPLSVLVCASRIDELSGIHRELLAAGIPEADIGIVHSKPSDPTSVKPTTDNANRRIMLATHERVKGGSLPLDLTHYRGRKRDLVVWDESLMVSSARSIELGDLIPDILWLQARVQTVGLASTDLDAAVAYLTTCLRLIEVERQRQSRRRGRRPNVLTMPRITGEILAAFKDALPVDDRVASIRDFLDMALEPLRIVNVNQGGGILKYDLAIPSWMDRVVVLDASAPIRELVKADDGILIDPWFTGTNLKRYDHLTIKWLRMPGGRAAMTKAFERPPEDRELSRMIARLVAGIPADDRLRDPEGSCSARHHRRQDARRSHRGMGSRG